MHNHRYMQVVDSLRHALDVSFVGAAAGRRKVDVLYAGAAAVRRMVGVPFVGESAS